MTHCSANSFRLFIHGFRQGLADSLAAACTLSSSHQHKIIIIIIIAWSPLAWLERARQCQATRHHTYSSSRALIYGQWDGKPLVFLVLWMRSAAKEATSTFCGVWGALDWPAPSLLFPSANRNGWKSSSTLYSPKRKVESVWRNLTSTWKSSHSFHLFPQTLKSEQYGDLIWFCMSPVQRWHTNLWSIPILPDKWIISFSYVQGAWGV